MSNFIRRRVALLATAAVALHFLSYGSAFANAGNVGDIDPANRNAVTARTDADVTFEKFVIPENAELMTLGTISSFDAGARDEWNLRSSLDSNATFGYQPRGFDGTMLRLSFSMKKDVKNKWMNLRTSVAPTKRWKDADGFRIILRLKKPGKWWLVASVDDGTRKYNTIIKPHRYAGMFEDRLIEFNKLTAKDGSTVDPEKIETFTLSGAAYLNNVLYIDRLLLYKKFNLESWLKVDALENRGAVHAGSRKRQNMDVFERGQPVTLKFGRGGEEDEASKGFAYVIKDYFKSEAARGEVRFADQENYEVDLGVMKPGFYTIHAYFIDGKGDVRFPRSCIKMPGSIDTGLATFAVLPTTKAERRQASIDEGEDYFFGFHGDPDVGEAMGAYWSLGQKRWIWMEKEKPQRGEDGMAEWAKKWIKEGHRGSGKPAPAYDYAMLNWHLNFGGKAPEWARHEDWEHTRPPIKNWEDYFAFVRDHSKVYQYLYPHMKFRVYDFLWEVNLSGPPSFIHKPQYGPEDIVETYKTIGPVVKEVDPKARVAGACRSAMMKPGSVEWHKELFDAGLLNYIDILNGHYYHSPPPESEKLPEKIMALKNLMKERIGKVLPMYNSESGYVSLYGSENKIYEHGRWNVRSAIIFKGEGVTVHMPFYGYDYGFDEVKTYGFMFNLHPDVIFHGDLRLMPKPAFSGYAACISILAKSKPVNNLRFFGDEVWGYVFDKEGEPIITVWTPGADKRFALPVGDVEEVRVADMMGNVRTERVEDGLLRMTLSGDVQYILDASSDIYFSTRMRGGPMEESDAVTVYPGDEREITVFTDQKRTITGVRAYGAVKAEVTRKPSVIAVEVDDDALSAPIALDIAYRDADGREKHAVRWLAVGGAIRVNRVEGVVREDGFGVEVAVENLARQPANTSITFESGQTDKQQEAVIEPKTVKRFVIPFMLRGKERERMAKSIKLTIKAGDTFKQVIEDKLVFLAAHHATKRKVENRFPNTGVVSGEGSSGKENEARLSFQWDKKNLYVTIAVEDDKFYQTKTDATIWMHDSVQLAFDTHPASDDMYSALQSFFSKKVTSFAVAKTPEGPYAYRHTTHNDDQLKQGEITDEIGIDIDVKQGGNAIYKLAIPWEQIGVDREVPHLTPDFGYELGMSVLINDKDGEDTPRRGIEFFKGIMRGRKYEEFGRLVLQ